MNTKENLLRNSFLKLIADSLSSFLNWKYSYTVNSYNTNPDAAKKMCQDLYYIKHKKQHSFVK